MAKEQDLAEVSADMSKAKDALLFAYNDLGVEMQQRGTVARHRLDAVKEACDALCESLPKETRKLNAEVEGKQ